MRARGVLWGERARGRGSLGRYGRAENETWIFVELESQEIGVDGMEGSAKDLENARRELEVYFDAVQSKIEGEVVVAEDDEGNEDGVEELEFLERPRVRICKLEMRYVGGI